MLNILNLIGSEYLCWKKAPKIDDLLTSESLDKATDRVAGLLNMQVFNYQSLIELGIIVAGIFV